MVITPYKLNDTFLEAISYLDTTIDNLFDWLCSNSLKVTPSKCHLFLSPFNSKSINVKNYSIEGRCSKNAPE